VIRQAKAPSLFTTRFDEAIDRWAEELPASLQRAFRAEFSTFGAQYEAALDTLEQILERRERASGFDDSTGLATRRSFLDYLTELLHEGPATEFNAVGVLFIDLNDLKRINDSAGHDVGDRAIATVGRIIRDALRERYVDRVDRVTDDDAYAVGRHGGDEFVAAVHLAAPDELSQVACRVKQRADDPARQRMLGYTGPMRLTVSLGGVVYEFSDPPAPVAPNSLAKALLGAADSLMYESKRDGAIHVALARFTTRLETYNVRRVAVA
jgi:diguanylate cyclase (GGDEF)-like protein